MSMLDTATQPDRLTVPVHFVCPDERVWPPLKEGHGLPLAARDVSRFSGGILNNWILRTYHAFRAAGENVSLSDRCRRDAINVVAGVEFGKKQRFNIDYVVAIRADAHEPCLANFTIMQNQEFAETGTRANIEHWPQPGIIPRDPARGTRLEVLSFKGHAQNLAPDYKDQAFLDALADLGMRLEIDVRDKTTNAHNWHDYSETDAVLAVRNLTVYASRLKPASKLTNAWLAGTLAMLGPEHAFEALRRDELDFLTVRSPADVLTHLATLKDNPSLYQALLDRAHERAKEVDEAHLLTVWRQTLNTKIGPQFMAWQKRFYPLKAAEVAYGILAESFSKKRHLRRAAAGDRILDA